MAKRLATIGDATTTGGKIINGKQNITIMGKSVALMGDMATCPACNKGIGPIIEGAGNWLVEGVPAAYDGCIIACGCPVGTNRIVASQSMVTVEIQNYRQSSQIPATTQTSTTITSYTTASQSNTHYPLFSAVASERQYSPSNKAFYHSDSQVNYYNNTQQITDHIGHEEVEAYVLITYAYQIGSIGEWADHAALYIHIKGDASFLYDPNGSYLQGTRGSGGFFSGEEADLTAYKDYHKKGDNLIRLEKIKITLTSQQAKNIIAKAMDLGDRGVALYCAMNVSNVLMDDYGNEGNIYFPGNLKEEIIKIEKTKRNLK